MDQDGGLGDAGSEDPRLDDRGEDPGQEPTPVELDWFGHVMPQPRTGARLAVPCPFCSELFHEGPALAGHLAAAHDYQVTRRSSPLDRLPGWLRGLGFLPLWFVLPMTIGFVVLVYAALSPIDVLLALFVSALSTFPLVLVLAHRVFSRRA
jgi:hypothetical protein